MGTRKVITTDSQRYVWDESNAREKERGRVRRRERAKGEKGHKGINVARDSNLMVRKVEVGCWIERGSSSSRPFRSPPISRGTLTNIQSVQKLSEKEFGNK